MPKPNNLNFSGLRLPEGITQMDVRRLSTQPKLIAKFDRDYGAGQWGAKELIAYLESDDVKKRRAKNRKDARSGEINARLEEYTDSFENITPNDLAMFENLVGIELRMDSIRKDLDSATEPAALDKLAKALQTLSAEHRQIQTVLGIGRSKRGEQFNLQHELDNFLKSADELVHSQSIVIHCTECQSDIDLGFILYYFKDNTPWTFMFNCPKCGKLIYQSGSVSFGNSPSLGSTQNGDEVSGPVLGVSELIPDERTVIGLGVPPIDLSEKLSLLVPALSAAPDSDRDE